MKLAIVGTRELSGLSIVEDAVERFLSAFEEFDMVGVFRERPVITEIVSGGARGVDRLAELYANKIGVPCKVFEPKTSRFGNFKQAANARNQQIIDYADFILAIRLSGQSPGTDDAIARAKLSCKPFVSFNLTIEKSEFHRGNRST